MKSADSCENYGSGKKVKIRKNLLSCCCCSFSIFYLFEDGVGRVIESVCPSIVLTSHYCLIRFHPQLVTVVMFLHF